MLNNYWTNFYLYFWEFFNHNDPASLGKLKRYFNNIKNVQYVQCGKEFYYLQDKIVKEKLKEFFNDVPGHVKYVPVNFQEENLQSCLFQNGYDSGLRTLFIWEGVTMYLTAGAVDKTLDFISKNPAPGSSVIFDYCPPSVAAGTCDFTEAKTMMKKLKRQGEPFTFGLEERNITSFLVSRGFDQVNNINGRD